MVAKKVNEELHEPAVAVESAVAGTDAEPQDEVGGPASSEEETPVDPEPAPVEASPEPAAAEATTTYIARRHIIRNGKDYFPGDAISFEPALYGFHYTDTGAIPQVESEADLAAHIAELKATGTIEEA